ncbi:hypothetical protein [Kribbella sp. DT2]|uniref:hypothetical protein n=1 Tax=Kribbella sp. DT2 TaxID=3393427 RepID=UPI003CEDBB64
MIEQTDDAKVPPRDDDASLRSRVLTAMTTGLATTADTVTPSFETLPAGVPVTAEASGTRVSYYIQDTLIATWQWRVHGRDPRVTLDMLTPEVYEQRYNGYRNLEAIHHQVLENLSGTPCVLRSTFTGAGTVEWAPYYDWAPGLTNLHAANLKYAVELVSNAASGQTVWDATDLPARVKLIAGPDPSLETGEGSWRHLITSTTPQSLFTGLNGINEHLGRTVFSTVTAWHGVRVIQ